MYTITACYLIFVIKISSYSCWVMTDINLEKLKLENGMNYLDDDEMNAEDIDLRRFNLIYPGTKWCGAGNIAVDYDDLGTANETDACCRTHDNCPDFIPAGETKHNLTNKVFYTRLHCDCDESFRHCLQDANTSTSNRIGTLYFNVIGTKCYRLDYPVIGCNIKGGWFNSKCLEYRYNTSAEQVYQWFDVNKY